MKKKNYIYSYLYCYFNKYLLWIAQLKDPPPHQILQNLLYKQENTFKVTQYIIYTMQANNGLQ